MLKILKPADFPRESKRKTMGKLTLRIDLKNIAFSKRLAIEMDLQKGDHISVAQDGEDIFICKGSSEDFQISGGKDIKIWNLSLSKFLLNHYRLLDILKTAMVSKYHRFPLEKKLIDGKFYYRLIPPTKYTPPATTLNGRKAEPV